MKLYQVDFPTIYSAELAIRTLVQKDNHSEAFLHTEFEYNEAGQIIVSRLNLITMNPKHQTPFLLHSVEITNDRAYHPPSTNWLVLYKQMYVYVYNLKEALKSKGSTLLHYTVLWMDATGTNHTSYFSGESVEDILRKFNFGKSKPPTLMSLRLNPLS